MAGGLQYFSKQKKIVFTLRSGGLCIETQMIKKMVSYTFPIKNQQFVLELLHLDIRIIKTFLAYPESCHPVKVKDQIKFSGSS